MKLPRPSSILYGSSLRVCTCRRGSHSARQVFADFEAASAVERDEEARRNPAVFMTEKRRRRKESRKAFAFAGHFEVGYEFLLDATVRADFRFRSSANFYPL